MLGSIDFSVVDDFDPVAADRYPGQTGTWELKDANDGKSKNIVVKYPFEFTDAEGNDKTRTHSQYYNLKPAALWRLKRDLISLGADPDALKQKDVDLESLLNTIFSTIPKAVWLHMVVGTLPARDGGEARPTNNLDKVELREA